MLKKRNIIQLLLTCIVLLTIFPNAVHVVKADAGNLITSENIAENNETFNSFDKTASIRLATKKTPVTKDLIEKFVEEIVSNKGKKKADLKYTDAWCAAYVNDCLNKVGISNLPYNAVASNYFAVLYHAGYEGAWFQGISDLTPEWRLNNSYSEYSSMPYSDYKPQRGDIVFFNNETKYIQHVGVVSAYNSTRKTVTVISGNWNNSQVPGGRVAESIFKIDGSKAEGTRLCAYIRLSEYRTTNKFCVSYFANGGSGVPVAQTKVGGIELTLSKQNPIRSGYSFIGWSTTSTGVVQYNPGDKYIRNANVTLYAVWKKNTLSIKYNSNGGVLSSGVYMTSNSGTLQRNSTDAIWTWTYGVAHKNGMLNPVGVGMTRPNYTFVGWSLSKDGSTFVYDEADDTIKPEDIYPDLKNKNASIILYAIWKACPPEVELSWDKTVLALNEKTYLHVRPINVPEGSYCFINIQNGDAIINANLVESNYGMDTVAVTGWQSGSSTLTVGYRDRNDNVLCSRTMQYTVTAPAGIELSWNNQTTLDLGENTYLYAKPVNAPEGSYCFVTVDNDDEVILASTAQSPYNQTDPIHVTGWRPGKAVLTLGCKDRTGAVLYNQTICFTVTTPDYTVQFCANGGGGSMDSQKIQYGGGLILPENMFSPPAGKQFKEWEWVEMGTHVAPATNYSVTSNMTFSAIWEDAPPTAIIHFEVDGDNSDSESIIISQGEIFKLPENSFTPPEGKCFRSWLCVFGKTELTLYPGEASLYLPPDSDILWLNMPNRSYTLSGVKEVILRPTWMDDDKSVIHFAGTGLDDMIVDKGYVLTLPKYSDSFSYVTEWLIEDEKYLSGDMLEVTNNLVIIPVFLEITVTGESIQHPGQIIVMGQTFAVRTVSVSKSVVTVEVENDTDGSGTLLVASYQSNGKLLSTASTLVNTSETITLTLNTQGASKVLAFLFDDQLKPLSKNYEMLIYSTDS